MEIRQKIVDILKSVNNDIDYECATDLIESGAIDSFDIVSIVSSLNELFDIEIGVVDLIPENFQTVDTIVVLVNKLLDE